MCFPQKGTLTDAGDGGGDGVRGHKITKTIFFLYFSTRKGTLTDAETKHVQNIYSFIYTLYYINYMIYSIYVLYFVYL